MNHYVLKCINNIVVSMKKKLFYIVLLILRHNIMYRSNDQGCTLQSKNSNYNILTFIIVNPYTKIHYNFEKCKNSNKYIYITYYIKQLMVSFIKINAIRDMYRIVMDNINKWNELNLLFFT